METPGDVDSDTGIATGPWGFDLSGMDDNVGPGRDFYGYANGNWLKQTIIPPNITYWTQHGAMDVQIDAQLRGLLEQGAKVQSKGGALHYASPGLRSDRDVVLAAVRQYGRALEYAVPALQADRDVVLAAVQQDGRALQFAFPALQSDRDVVLAAVQQYGRALNYASEELQADRVVVLAAVRKDRVALLYASLDMQEYVARWQRRRPLVLLHVLLQKERAEVVPHGDEGTHITVALLRLRAPLFRRIVQYI